MKMITICFAVLNIELIDGNINVLPNSQGVLKGMIYGHDISCDSDD